MKANDLQSLLILGYESGLFIEYSSVNDNQISRTMNVLEVGDTSRPERYTSEIDGSILHYILALEQKKFSAKCRDEALIQIKLLVDRKKIVSYRYCYLPAVGRTTPFEELPIAMDEDEQIGAVIRIPRAGVIRFELTQKLTLFLTQHLIYI